MKLNKNSLALASALALMTVGTVASTTVLAQETSRLGAPSHDEHHDALIDGQILQIVRVLNDGEIKQANEALDESESAAVKELAEMIITDHESANEQIDELLNGDIDLDDSPLSETLEAQAENTHEMLQDLSGAQYDCAYLQQQVAQHETALSTAKTQLMPNAKDTGVTQLLTAMGPKLEHHMEMAKASLDNSPGCN